jgi:AcrR family transcriptional regulator
VNPTPTDTSPTRQALMDAALAVFVERGFARATTREIARRAGLSEGTMYRHFTDKYELFHQVFLSLVLDTGKELKRLPERAGQNTVRDNLEYLFLLVGQMQGDLSSLMASTWADPDLSRSFDSYVREKSPEGFVRPEPVAIVAEYIKAEQRLGRIRLDVDATEAAAVVASIPFAAGMERALWANFAPSGGPSAHGDFPFPAAGALDILARGLAP